MGPSITIQPKHEKFAIADLHALLGEVGGACPIVNDPSTFVLTGGAPHPIHEVTENGPYWKMPQVHISAEQIQFSVNWVDNERADLMKVAKAIADKYEIFGECTDGRKYPDAEAIFAWVKNWSMPR